MNRPLEARTTQTRDVIVLVGFRRAGIAAHVAADVPELLRATVLLEPHGLPAQVTGRQAPSCWSCAAT